MPLHECVHGTAFKSRWLNLLVANVTGIHLPIHFPISFPFPINLQWQSNPFCQSIVFVFLFPFLNFFHWINSWTFSQSMNLWINFSNFNPITVKLASTESHFLSGFLTLRPPLHYRFYHYAHHRYTGDKQNDPELSDTFLDMELKDWKRYLFYLTGIPYWIDRFSTSLRHVFGVILQREKFLQKEAVAKRVIREARIFWALYCTIIVISNYLNTSAYFTYWILPSFIAQVGIYHRHSQILSSLF